MKTRITLSQLVSIYNLTHTRANRAQALGMFALLHGGTPRAMVSPLSRSRGECVNGQKQEDEDGEMHR